CRTTTSGAGRPGSSAAGACRRYVRVTPSTGRPRTTVVPGAAPSGSVDGTAAPGAVVGGAVAPVGRGLVDERPAEPLHATAIDPTRATSTTPRRTHHGRAVSRVRAHDDDTTPASAATAALRHTAAPAGHAAAPAAARLPAPVDDAGRAAPPGLRR